jgi:hypothetical protein
MVDFRGGKKLTDIQEVVRSASEVGVQQSSVVGVFRSEHQARMITHLHKITEVKHTVIVERSSEKGLCHIFRNKLRNFLTPPPPPQIVFHLNADCV